jgi:hypothetical protein
MSGWTSKQRRPASTMIWGRCGPRGRAFGIETIGDLADNPLVRAALAIREMAKVAEPPA